MPPQAHSMYRLSIPAGKAGWSEIVPVDAPVLDEDRPDSVAVTLDAVRLIIRWFAADSMPTPPLVISGRSQSGKTRLAVAAGNEWVHADPGSDHAADQSSGGVPIDPRVRHGLTGAYVTSAEQAKRLTMTSGLVILDFPVGLEPWDYKVAVGVAQTRADRNLRTILCTNEIPDSLRTNSVHVDLKMSAMLIC